MICLILTIFSHVFQTGWITGKESGGIKERTFIAVKPDGLQRRLVGEIICRFEQKGFKLVGLKLLQAPEAALREHYQDLRGETFFSGLLCYLGSGPVVAMVWQGLDVVKTSRRMLGETDPASSLPDPASSLPDPASSLPGTIRGDFCIQLERNMIHSSESVEGAQREISLWFRPPELQIWDDCSSRWIYD